MEAPLSTVQHDPSSHLLNVAEMAARFREDGYLVVRCLFGGVELDAIREEAAQQIAAGTDDRPGLHVRRGVSSEGMEVLFGIDAVVTNALRSDVSLKALGHPGMLAVASALLAGEMLNWSDALLWKGPDGGAAVGMHSAHGWNDLSFIHENLVAAIYLDEATPDNGCLKVVPGSHLLSPEENRAVLAQGYGAPGIIDVTLEAGDVLFHSEWMAHGSGATPRLGRATRRLLYFAFRPPVVFAPPGCTPSMRRKVAAGMRRLQLAIERRGTMPYGQQEKPFDFTPPPGWVTDVAAVEDGEALRVGYFVDMLEAPAP